MIEKVSIAEANIIEQIRSKLPIATVNDNGLMGKQDRLMYLHWERQIGLYKSLYIGRFAVNTSMTITAISGNGKTAAQAPNPNIISITNHSSNGLKFTKIGDGGNWGYINDGEYINLYYEVTPFLGGGVFILSYSSVELFMNFVDTPADLVLF